ncbi:VTT domain-containing protein, partial [Ruminococcus sp.]|uniref:VTT domain-containing protein n=2 Tax=Ruminococcus sp. TaxID=41978 RepID=UPI003AB3A04B
MRNKIAFRVALGGICSAVCLLLMFSSSFLPMLDYTIPTFAGFMMVVMIVEVDKNWAIATYCAVSLLSIFVTPNYEATLLFILFMGYYPILKYYLDQKKNRLLVWAIKLAVFNVAIVIFFLAFQYIFTSVDMLEGMEMFGKYAVLVLWAAANLFFFVYDYALTQLTDMYINWFRKKIQIISLVAIIAVIAMATAACIPLIKALHSKAGIAALERKLDNYSGIVGVLIFTFIQALQVVIAVIPPIQVVGGVLFGWFWGGLLSFIGTLLGTMAIFVLVKKFGRPIVEAFVDEKQLKKF